MRDHIPASYSSDSSEGYLKPQASYPGQSGPYNSPQQLSGSQYSGGMPPQPYPYQNAYPAYPPQQLGPQYQVPINQPPQAVNVNIVNTQNGYPQEIYDPHRGQATTALTLGIIAVIIWIIPFVGTLISLICAIIGFIVSFQGRKSITRSGAATTGLVLSIIALVLIIGQVLLFGTAFLTLLGAQHAIHSTP